MSVTEELEMTEEHELKETKHPQFRVLTGGKGPPEPPWIEHDWLSECALGTTFVARHRNSKDVDYNQYFVLFKAPKVVLLKWILPDGKLLDYYVDPERFSKMFPDYVILGVNELQANEPEPGPPGTDEDKHD